MQTPFRESERSGETSGLEVLIAGGGLVGATLAVALGRAGVPVAVVEPSSRREAAPPGFDDRHTALAPTSRRLFEALGLWDELAAEAEPIREIHVSDRGYCGFTRLSAAAEGLPALGYVVPNRRLGEVLLPAAERCPAVRWLAPARVTGVTPEVDRIVVQIESEDGAERLAARLLAVADGADSATRARLGIAARRRPYRQTAIITNARFRRAHGGRAFERFTDSGPIAVLPAADDNCAVIWTVPQSAAEGVMALSDADFRAALQARFGQRLGELLRTGRRAAYPLAAVMAHRLAGDRAAVVGNAAHALHPVAGQGFNLALRDVADLAELVVEALAAGADPAEPDRLAGFDARRRQDARRTLGFTDGLIRIFGSGLPLLAPARNAALVALDLLPTARRAFLRQATGRAGRLPRLACGVPLPRLEAS